MRNDGVSKLYRPSQQMDKLNKMLFALNIACIALSCFLADTFLQITLVLQILFSLAFVIVEVLDDGIFWYNAENIRRINCIETAFQVNLSEYKTNGYYNNNFEPSFVKYLMNTFESNFFTVNITRKMFPKTIIKAFSALILFVISCLCLSSEITVIVAEAIFSSIVMVDAVLMMVYIVRMKHLYESAYAQLVSFDILNQPQLVWALSYIMEYESIKAHYKIRLDKKIFNKLNPKLSEEWNKLQKNIFLRLTSN